MRTESSMLLIFFPGRGSNDNTIAALKVFLGGMNSTFPSKELVTARGEQGCKGQLCQGTAEKSSDLGMFPQSFYICSLGTATIRQCVLWLGKLSRKLI